MEGNFMADDGKNTSLPVMKKERIEFIDLAKGVCILLVVAVHILPWFGERFSFLSCLRMPLYFCLSGLFYKGYGGFRRLALKKVNKLLVPFIAWYLIGYVVYYAGRLISPSGEASFHILDILYRNEIFNLPIWFLLCLFWSNLLYSIICRLLKKWYLRLAGVLLVASVGWIMMECEVFNLFYFGTSMTCLPFFYMGYALKRTALLYPTTNKKRDFIIMALCLGVATLLVFIPSTPPRLGYYKNVVDAGTPLQIYACSAFFVVGVLLLCKFVNRVPFVSWLGRYSIIVLVVHGWLGEILRVGMQRVSPSAINEDLLGIIIFAVVLLSMLIIIPLSIKYLPYITAQKDIFKTD